MQSMQYNQLFKSIFMFMLAVEKRVTFKCIFLSRRENHVNKLLAEVTVDAVCDQQANSRTSLCN